jgi:hypothetical protein
MALSITTLCFIMLSFIMLRHIFSYCYAEYRYAEYYGALSRLLMDTLFPKPDNILGTIHKALAPTFFTCKLGGLSAHHNKKIVNCRWLVINTSCLH